MLAREFHMRVYGSSKLILLLDALVSEIRDNEYNRRSVYKRALFSRDTNTKITVAPYADQFWVIDNDNERADFVQLIDAGLYIKLKYRDNEMTSTVVDIGNGISEAKITRRSNKLGLEERSLEGVLSLALNENKLFIPDINVYDKYLELLSNGFPTISEFRYVENFYDQRRNFNDEFKHLSYAALVALEIFSHKWRII